MTAWRRETANTVRERIATLVLRSDTNVARLGSIILRDHQREAAGRLRDSIARVGGALLADEVGLGKTYTALAAAGDARPLLIVAPSALADMWRDALERARTDATFVSFETLSRQTRPVAPPALVIVDEAHHVRNPLTQRYARLAGLTRSAHVLLLSATPVHNATADLHALLALFLGSRAERMTAGELSVCIVRRTRRDMRDAQIPHRAPPVWVSLSGSRRVLEALTEIPPPCPPRDGSDGGSLIIMTLVKAWASSTAALRAALLRRIARAGALSDALSTGRHPTRAELLAWVVGDDATQLAFPELMVATLTGEWRTLSESVERHVAGVRRALAIIADDDSDVDGRRCAIIRDIRARHPGERIVVFSQFADSVRAMFARLRRDGRVAAVTASGAEVASGPLTRTEVLARFAPTTAGRSAGRIAPKRAEEIDLLIATDLLSEGLNLQDASVVVHLDLPWTAARVTQRLGRVWRMASPHARVHEYAIAPPAPADDLLRLTETLVTKAGTASRAVGDAIAPLLAQLPRSDDACPDRGSCDPDPTTARELLRRLMRTWSVANTSDDEDAATAPTANERVPVAAVRAPFDGWLAVVTHAGSPHIVAMRTPGAPTADPAGALAVAREASGRPCIPAPARLARARQEIETYMTAQRAGQDVELAVVGSRAHSAASTRIATVAAGAPPHRRVAVSRLAASARRAVTSSRSAGAERLLNALLDSDASGSDSSDAGEAWLSRLIELGDGPAPNAAAGEAAEAAHDDPQVHAVLLLIG